MIKKECCEKQHSFFTVHTAAWIEYSLNQYHV